MGNDHAPTDQDTDVFRACNAKAQRVAATNHWIAEAGVIQSVDSPLERWMWWALTAYTISDPRLSAASQVDIGRYRADFLVVGETPFDGVMHVVVEVDGHEFHERTKAQARHDKQRDREMTRLGYRVMRFTGSEVYAKPLDCAEQVVRVIETYGLHDDSFDEVGA